MSGRAGRRGLDSKGKVISFFAEERDIPTPDELVDMLGKKGESLKSKFKLSYSILFNALGSQVVELEDIMKKSFGEN
jgi:superfamily II RNA helicase